jgi:hypothetical protein
MVEGLSDVVALTTGHLPLLLSAITGGRHRDLAGAAHPGMAGLCAVVLSAGEKIAAGLMATPALSVIGLGASSSRSILAAETGLGWAHQGARRARAGVAHQ